MDYMDDPELSWAAVGLLAFLERHGTSRLDGLDALTLVRGAYRWHPEDRGDLEMAWDQCLAIGYLYEINGGFGVYLTRGDDA